MVCCAAFGCSNDSKTGKEHTYHKFPSDKTLGNKWCSAMKRKGFVPTKHSRVCSAHFRPDNFETLDRGGKPLKVKRLKKDAVPSIFSGDCLPSYLQVPEKKPRRVLVKRSNSAKVKIENVMPKLPPVCLNDEFPCCEREAWLHKPIVSTMCMKCALFSCDNLRPKIPSSTSLEAAEGERDQGFLPPVDAVKAAEGERDQGVLPLVAAVEAAEGKQDTDTRLLTQSPTARASIAEKSSGTSRTPRECQATLEPTNGAGILPLVAGVERVAPAQEMSAHCTTKSKDTNNAATPHACLDMDSILNRIKYLEEQVVKRDVQIAEDKIIKKKLRRKVKYLRKGNSELLSVIANLRKKTNDFQGSSSCS